MSAAISQQPRVPPQARVVKAPRLPDVDDGSELPVDADPPERRREPRPLAEAVRTILRRFDIADDGWMRELLDAWPQLAGPDVARSARPGKLDNGVLYLYVNNSTRLFEIRRAHLHALEASIRRHCGPELVRHVRLSLDPDLSPLAPGSP